MEDEEKIKFKQLLKSVCMDLLKKRMEAAELAMTDAQESANSEEKSSAGDKYETGRAMGHLARDLNAKQFNEAKKDLQLLEAIRADKINETFIAGSVAQCDDAYYFLSSGLGNIIIDEKKIVALSLQAPLSMAMLHKKTGDHIFFKGRKFNFLDVY